MSDDEQPPSRSGNRRAVAHLAEALAAAQAVARANDMETDVLSPESSGKSEDVASGDGDVAGPSLRERIDALEPVTPSEVPIVNSPGRTSRRMWPLYATIAVLILAVPVLVTAGYRLTSRSTTGVVISGSNSPNAPGYTALVEPTPVALVIQTSASGTPESLTLLTLDGPGQKGGAVVTIPVDTRLAHARHGLETFRQVIDAASTDKAGAIIGKELGLGFTDVIALSDSELTRFVEPVAPLRVKNPDDVILSDGTELPVGNVTLTASQVGRFLASGDADGSIDAQMKRRQLLWSTWIAAIAKAKGRPGVVPGETKTGLGRYLTGLAAGSVTTAPLPTVPADELEGKHTVGIDGALTRLMISNAVPFPVGATKGSRVTVSLLNGTGPTSAPPAVIQRLTYAGAQIISIGNATGFDVDKTTLTYSDPKIEAFVRLMAGTLGVGKVQFVRSADTTPQVTIVMGRDLLRDPPARLTVEDVQ